MQLRYFFHRLLHWEYWPQWLLYAPVFPVYLYYAIRARTPFFVVAANPDMENGGYLMESKFTIYNQLPRQLVPATLLIQPAQPGREVLQIMEKACIGFPCFCKPDVGGRGMGVVKITSKQQLLHYHQSVAFSYLIQTAITFPYEAGIFYCRMPDSPAGKITGIVEKRNMVLTGNGRHTVKALIDAVPRYYFQRTFLYRQYKNSLDTVLPANEKMMLLEVGNHARGSEFRDISYRNNSRLEKLIDAVSKEYGNFCFGRYDIKFQSWEELYEGKNFMIVELNGSGSEPTHLYDPEKSITAVWKIILQHWKLLFKISAYHHQNGVPYLSFQKGRVLQREYRKLSKKIAGSTPLFCR